MDKALENPHEETPDLIHSLGKEYATRAEEEGFGVICGKNQTITKVRIDEETHGKQFAYEETRRTEVKEETAPNQPEA